MKKEHELIGCYVRGILDALDDAVEQGLKLSELITLTNEIISDYGVDVEYSEISPKHFPVPPENMGMDKYLKWIMELK